MNIELLCKFIKDPSTESLEAIEQELQVQALIKGDDFDIEAEREKLLLNDSGNFEYAPMVIGLDGVASFNMVDEEHVCVRFHDTTKYNFKITYQQFKAVYQTVTGLIIHDFTNPAQLNIKD